MQKKQANVTQKYERCDGLSWDISARGKQDYYYLS